MEGGGCLEGGNSHLAQGRLPSMATLTENLSSESCVLPTEMKGLTHPPLHLIVWGTPDTGSVGYAIEGGARTVIAGLVTFSFVLSITLGSIIVRRAVSQRVGGR